MRSYDDLTSVLRKKGKYGTDAECAVLRDFIQSQVISPAFVHRVLQDEPEESLRAEFGLNDDVPSYWLDWLLRCWKGEFYRTRYPSVSML